MIRDQAGRFFANGFAPRLDAWRQSGAVDAASWAEAGSSGLLCASIPEVYGGGGGGLAHEIVIQQEVSRAGLGSSFGIANMVHSGIVAHYILAYGSEAQKQRWLPAMARAERIGAIAMTEPGTGSDLQAIHTSAKRVAGGFLVSGQKTFISNGQTANLIAVVVRTGAEAGKGLSILMVETEDAAGFERGRKLEKIGLDAQDTSELSFQDMFVPQDNLLGKEGDGFRQLKHQLVWERMMIAIDAVVNIERAVELTIAYTRERSVFGNALIDFQNTQFVLADAKAQVLVACSFIDAMIARLLSGDLDAATAAAAKLWATETQCKVIDACLQLFGGYGYMTEYPIGRLYADARASRIYGGTSEIMKLIVARAL
ncbi:MAG: acyl-CoA dehydrogenase [Sphingomonadales bacterium]|nr:MAG: acyl-CoA dehydrogenase [Sphingomonadales bacterium]